MAVVLAGATTQPLTTASAQDFLDFLFGGFRRVLPPMMRPERPERSEHAGRDRSGGRIAYCVRLCDGRYFPIGVFNGASPEELCHRLCPASATRLFYGDTIDNAEDLGGKTYTAVHNAFRYRKEIVSACSCNGRTGFGLAHIPLDLDPTLRKGDVIASTSGFKVYQGAGENGQGAYTPVDLARLPRDVREELAGLKIRGVHTPLQDRSVPLPVPRPRSLSRADSDIRLSARER